MTRGFFRTYLAMLAALVLFSLSPLAALGGMVVVAFLFVPAALVLGALGVLEKGSALDGQVAMLFWAGAGVFALIALGLAYVAADHSEKGQADKARAFTANAATAAVLPVVVYFCYTALGI